MTFRPTTFRLTLPDGKRVVCWRKDAAAIFRDVAATGSVMLVSDPVTGVYDRIAPDSVEAAEIAPAARIVDGGDS